MNNILITGFKGFNNSSRILLDNINNKFDKLYLENDFNISVNQMINQLNNNSYDLIIAFGQKPNIKSIYIETIGKGQNIQYETTYNFSNLYSELIKNNFKVKISSNAGNYLCNNIYYNTMKYIKENKINMNILFIHIPYSGNFEKSKDFLNFIESFSF